LAACRVIVTIGAFQEDLWMTDVESRCWWCLGSDDYIAYHDEEWGRPVVDDHRLFEKICLEGFQSGLSWLTILRKRERFRTVFHDFDFERVARFTERDVKRLLGDAGIIRHRGKIEATINNARRAIELVKERGSLAAYFWTYEPAPSSRPKRMTREAVSKLTVCDEAKAMAKDLKKRGWRFVGPTTAYAFMQAMGLVNDHTEECAFRSIALAERAALSVPT
jgi:DNA-3-methyladenine glycosylase I